LDLPTETEVDQTFEGVPFAEGLILA